MIILGAGLAGCIAGIMNPDAVVYEAEPSPPGHRAVLRFRSPVVSDVTGIPFQQVHVTKEVYTTEPNKSETALANQYALKVTGQLSRRSIWHLEPVTRWVAPENLHEQLILRLGDRAFFGGRVGSISEDKLAFDDGTIRLRSKVEPIISTLPMPVMAQIVGHETMQDITWPRQKIVTRSARVHSCNLHQTIYFPDPITPVYRATITGDRLIIEATSKPNRMDEEEVLKAFGLTEFHITWLDEQDWSTRYGKIDTIDETQRKAFMLWLTLKHNVFCLGRFATWRNILLDDVVDDMLKITTMVDNYDVLKRALL